MTMNNQMYRALILDHHRHPRNFGTINPADGSAQQDNPLCGDSIQITYAYDQGKQHIADIKFIGTGCSVTRAAASILTETVKGKSVDELKRYTDDDFLEDLGVPITPARKKCALLGLVTLRRALNIPNPSKKK